jgi:hypothetical protein
VRAPSDKVGNQPSTHASSPVYCTLLALRSTVGQYYFLSKQNILLARSTDIFFSLNITHPGFPHPRSNSRQLAAELICGGSSQQRRPKPNGEQTNRRARRQQGDDGSL